MAQITSAAICSPHLVFYNSGNKVASISSTRISKLTYFLSQNTGELPAMLDFFCLPTILPILHFLCPNIFHNLDIQATVDECLVELDTFVEIVLAETMNEMDVVVKLEGLWVRVFEDVFVDNDGGGGGDILVSIFSAIKDQVATRSTAKLYVCPSSVTQPFIDECRSEWIRSIEPNYKSGTYNEQALWAVVIFLRLYIRNLHQRYESSKACPPAVSWDTLGAAADSLEVTTFLGGTNAMENQLAEICGILDSAGKLERYATAPIQAQLAADNEPVAIFAMEAIHNLKL